MKNCGNNRGPILASNKAAKTGTAGAALEDTFWVNNKFIIYTNNDVAVWCDRDSDDRNNNGNET